MCTYDMDVSEQREKINSGNKYENWGVNRFSKNMINGFIWKYCYVTYYYLQ